LSVEFELPALALGLQVMIEKERCAMKPARTQNAKAVNFPENQEKCINGLGA
jgi:hypothetical protein